MAYCHGCGRYVGDYSAYRQNVPGKGELVLCYKCKQWADRHPGQTNFPPKQSAPFAEGKRVRTFANIYIISSLGLFAAGVCGNLYDRIFNDGSVRDFIDVYYRSFHWHTFNIADSLLCLGVAALIISTFLTEKPARKRDPQQK